MSFYNDFVVKDKEGKPVAVVEVKNYSSFTNDTAKHLRRNMIAHGLLKDVLYFLVVSQDVGYLWNNFKQNADSSSPLLEFSMDKVVNKFRVNKNASNRLTESELELIVMRWLLSLTELEDQIKDQEPEKSLVDVGFVNSINNGLITSGDNYDSIP